MRAIDEQIGAYSHLKSMPREAEALHTLKKIASCVKPIMRKRGWRVGTLSEFYPDQPNLLGLNINRGQTINVRLRYPQDARQFLPYEQVLDTMLHELVHIVQGPHDERFHRIWDELRDEWTALQIKGYTGEGFLGKGQKLGGQRIPNDELRRRARATAIERQKQSFGSAAGRRLGGSSSTTGNNFSGTGGFYGRPDPALLGAAASNRSTTTSGCGAGSVVAERAATEALRDGYRTTAEMTEEDEIAIQNALIELMEQEEERKLIGLPPHPSDEFRSTSEGLVWDPVNGLQEAPSRPASTPSTSTPSNKSPAPPTLNHHASTNMQSSTTHPLRNRSNPLPLSSQMSRSGRPLSRLVSDSDSTSKAKRSKISKSSNAIDLTATPSKNSDTWPCTVCTLLNAADVRRCEVCDSPRPAATGSQPVRMNTLPRRPVPSSTAVPPAPKVQKRMGWNCDSCGTFMDNQWWTCSFCGTMKSSSGG